MSIELKILIAVQSVAKHNVVGFEIAKIKVAVMSSFSVSAINPIRRVSCPGFASPPALGRFSPRSAI